ncbi:variable surface protein [Plasmodium gonderi]|uniref:Variable surface protein n=1 Tax=Plasmodium gonderi TaxID=77519 RepID=A0A1Y1JVQ9_PLAGO|nr:variable surface protein [Plasmodium gonderi]GAW83974.1 variable surface protein [Plasmodium gonderi]
MMGKRKFNTFHIFSIFLIMLFTYHYKNDATSEFVTLDNTYNIDGISGIRDYRILTKHEVQKSMKHRILGEKNKETKNEEVEAPTYEKIKTELLYGLNTYMRSYRYRYANRRGLGKLECSFEKKIFDIIRKIDKSRKCNNKNLKDTRHLKYGFGLVTACLIPFLGIILLVLDMIKSTTKDIINKGLQGNDPYLSILNSLGIPVEVYYIYIAFILILSYIILALFIYIIVKIVKYEKLERKNLFCFTLKLFLQCILDSYVNKYITDIHRTIFI